MIILNKIFDVFVTVTEAKYGKMVFQFDAFVNICRIVGCQQVDATEHGRSAAIDLLQDTPGAKKGECQKTRRRVIFARGSQLTIGTGNSEIVPATQRSNPVIRLTGINHASAIRHRLQIKWAFSTPHYARYFSNFAFPFQRAG